MCADDVRIACPLFQTECGGEVPTSALQLKFGLCPIDFAVALNKAWHSRLPLLRNPHVCFAYNGEFNGISYAVAMWSQPIARMFNGRGYLELRRMAISDDAPKFTASRMISFMVKHIKKTKPDVVKLISYQDTAVHSGTIYKASNWKIGSIRKANKVGDGWDTRDGRLVQTKDEDDINSSKVRWEYDIRQAKKALCHPSALKEG